MNIFRLLTEDHRAITDLLTRLEEPVDAGEFDSAGRRYLLDQLVLVASRHEAAEEIAFWPDVRRRLTHGAALADRGLAAERDMRALLDALRVTPGDEAIIAQATRLRTLVSDHVLFEEGEVFPAMRRSSTHVWRSLAGWRFQAAAKAAPTRPHPGGPDRPGGFLTVGAPALVWDHLRDRLDSRRRPPVGASELDHPDAVEVIQADHGRIRELLAVAAEPADPPDSTVEDLIRLLAGHDSIERQYLYPAVRRRLVERGGVYSRVIREHGVMAKHAARIEAYRFHDQYRRQWLHELAAGVREHMEFEESAVLPALRARLTTEELVQLGRQLEAARTKAPTRPHPHLAGAGTGARLSRRLARPLDKALDVVTRRPGRLPR